MASYEVQVAELEALCRTRRRRVLLLAGVIGGVITAAAGIMMAVSLHLLAPALIGWLILGTFVLKMARSKWAEIGKFERIQKHRLEEGGLTERRRT